jgi:hypothetical protein
MVHGIHVSTGFLWRMVAIWFFCPLTNKHVQSLLYRPEVGLQLPSAGTLHRLILTHAVEWSMLVAIHGFWLFGRRG